MKQTETSLQPSVFSLAYTKPVATHRLAALLRTWDMNGPVSTPMAELRNSCCRGSTVPFSPIATPFMLAKPGMAAKLAVAANSRRGGRLFAADSLTYATAGVTAIYFVRVPPTDVTAEVGCSTRSIISGAPHSHLTQNLTFDKKRTQCNPIAYE